MAASDRDSTDSPAAPGAGAPGSALELIGSHPDSSATDPAAARAALDAGAPTIEGDPDPGAPEGSRRDRRRRAGARPARKGGHKPTKEELEQEVKDLRARLESSAPEAIAAVQDQALQLAPALAATFATVFSMLARRRGEHWKLKAEEQQVLAQSWAPCLAPYMASAGPYVPWGLAVIVTWQVVEGRVERDQAAARVLSQAA